MHFPKFIVGGGLAAGRKYFGVVSAEIDPNLTYFATFPVPSLIEFWLSNANIRSYDNRFIIELNQMIAGTKITTKIIK